MEFFHPKPEYTLSMDFSKNCPFKVISSCKKWKFLTAYSDCLLRIRRKVFIHIRRIRQSILSYVENWHPVLAVPSLFLCPCTPSPCQHIAYAHANMLFMPMLTASQASFWNTSQGYAALLTALYNHNMCYKMHHFYAKSIKAYMANTRECGFFSLHEVVSEYAEYI